MEAIIVDEIIDGFHFRRIEPRDKGLFMGVRAEISEVAEFYRKFPDFSDYNWNLILKDDNEVGMVVFLQPDNLFVGTCSFQGVQKENLELGYDIAKELRGKGIGTRMVGALFQLAHKHFQEREIFVRVREDNSASRRVAEKNGAVFIKMDDPPEVIALQTLLEHNDDPTRAEEARAIAHDDEDNVVLILRLELRHHRDEGDRHTRRKLVLYAQTVLLYILSPSAAREQGNILSSAEQIARKIAADNTGTEYQNSHSKLHPISIASLVHELCKFFCQQLRVVDNVAVAEALKAADGQLRVCLTQQLNGSFHVSFFFTVPAGDFRRRLHGESGAVEIQPRRPGGADGFKADFIRDSAHHGLHTLLRLPHEAQRPGGHSLVPRRLVLLLRNDL